MPIRQELVPNVTSVKMARSLMALMAVKHPTAQESLTVLPVSARLTQQELDLSVPSVMPEKFSPTTALPAKTHLVITNVPTV